MGGGAVRRARPGASGHRQPPLVRAVVQGRVTVTGNRGILVVEDEDNTRAYMVGRLSKLGYEVIEAASLAEGIQAADTRVFDLVFLDLGLGRDDPHGERGRQLFAHLQSVAPDVPVIVVTADASAQSAVDLLRRGAFHYAVKPVEPEDLEHLARIGIELAATRRDLGVLRDVRRRAGEPSWHVGQTSRMQTIAHIVERFGPTDVGVLIQGDTGTGKEVVARALHERSGRTGEFVPLNCSAIPKDLFESQLFGHEKGSFTGAVERLRGLLELADGGTMFLDEITTMAPEMQAKLLRALQEFSFRRVGGQKEIKVDVRVISATNRDIGEAIRAGDFRSDLYYRLCVMTIELPPLRDRAADIPYFVQAFVAETRQRSATTVVGVSDAAMWALTHHPWPGNIRELRNVIERATILAMGEPEIDVVHLPANVRGIDPTAVGRADGQGGRDDLPAVLPPDGLDLKTVRDNWEQALVAQALARSAGNQSAAARLLGLTRDELRYRVDKFDMPAS
jgi:DNA-binding NtrC family response regulator